MTMLRTPWAAGSRTVALLVATTLVLAACGGGGAATGGGGGAGPVTFAVPVPTAYYMIPSLADKLGLFEEHGVDVEVQLIQPGAMSPALASGQVPYGLLPGPAVQELALGGSDVTMIANYIGKPMVSLVARPEITRIADLRGKTVAVGVPTSLSTIFAQELLRDHGLEDGSYQDRQIPDQPGQLSALLAGQVDAAMLSIPQVLVAKDKGMKVLTDLGTSDYVWPFAPVVTRSSYAEAHREQTVGLLAALQEAVKAWETDPEAAKEVIRTETKTTDPAVVDASYQAVLEALKTDMAPTVEEAGAPLDWLAEGGDAKAGSFEPGTLVDTSYLEEAGT